MLAEALVLASVVCGPSSATTLHSGAQTRLYTRAGTAYACARHGRRTIKLGGADQLRGVRISSQFVAITRTRGTQQLLTVYDVRRGREIERVPGVDFSAVRLARNGVATWQQAGTGGARMVAQSGGRLLEHAVGIDPGYVGVGGSVVAWRAAGMIRVRLGRLTPAGVLVRAGEVRIEADRKLRARLGDGAAVPLGAPYDSGDTSSGGDGVDALAIEGQFVAARYSADRSGTSAGALLRIVDLSTRAARNVCETVSGYVQRFVLAPSGRAVCAMRADGDQLQIRAENAVLDQGPGLSLDSLVRRGNELVWIKDGLEHTAPLP